MMLHRCVESCISVGAVPVRMPRPGLMHYISARARDEVSLASAELDIAERLRDRHRITGDKEDDFQVDNLASIAETGASILGIERHGKSIVNPNPSEKLEHGDTVLVLGNTEQMEAVRKLLS